MVNSFRFLFCSLACFFSINAYSAERTDYRDFTPEKAQQVASRWNASFDKVGKDIAYAQNYASGKMDNIVNQINNEHQVRTMIRDSGIDPDTGKKIRIEANVTQTANKAKVASTLADRLKKAGDYAKNAGKASIPAFVGGAAVQALVDGVGWVMDEGGKVTKPPSLEDQDVNTLQNIWFPLNLGNPTNETAIQYGASTAEAACKKLASTMYSSSYNKFISVEIIDNSAVCTLQHEAGPSYVLKPSVKLVSNPSYNPSAPQPENVEVTQEQLTEALKNALESNNPALASAISEAIKDAYTPEGKLASIGDEEANGLAANAADTARDAVTKASKNTGTEPTSSGKPGYYKITDGEKTVEGYVYPSDTSASTKTDTKTETTTDPATGNQTTTGTSTGSLQFPAFCDWAAIVCDWIGWTKEQPDEPEELKPVFEEINVPFTPFSIANFNAQCPPDEQLSLTLMEQEMSFVFPMKPFCDFFSGIKPFVIALASFWAVKLIGNASFNSGN
ncbi:virulence factor TspB C-terminal domain-related protein [Acinetobacter johnsonii]|uniref:virulence factor TspB C-terminal domain-related protein n=1 Tax=Acinetobacter johnsonii TaxID=40214 RepID=UPI0024475047|nr:virulence factor TspB C-terminal domain-related protein [Acinetobacter johnsonii]MDH1520153.1 virulence factor TspB C-terminal domain-related protein [Acinetobacter johnsonii]